MGSANSPTVLGRPYADLLTDLAFGKLRESSKHEACPPDEHLKNKEPAGPPAVPIALYRLRADSGANSFFRQASPDSCSGTPCEQRKVPTTPVDQTQTQSRGVGGGIGGNRFLLLAPPLDMPLRADDWVIVLAGESFGRRVHDGKF